MKVVVYSLPTAQCVRCRGSEIALRRAGIEYEKIMVNESPDALAYVKSLGYESAPVIVVLDDEGNQLDHFPFSIEKINALKVAA